MEYLEQLEAQYGKKPLITEKFKKRDRDKKSTGKESNEDEGEDSEEDIAIARREREDFRSIAKQMKEQSLDARLDIVHTQVWPVDFNYSLRRRTDSLDTEGTKKKKKTRKTDIKN